MNVVFYAWHAPHILKLHDLCDTTQVQYHIASESLKSHGYHRCHTPIQSTNSI